MTSEEMKSRIMEMVARLEDDSKLRFIYELLIRL